MFRRFLRVGLLALAGCSPQRQPVPSTPVAAGAAVTGAATSTPPAARSGAVTVAIVIDQFAAWVARDRLQTLPTAGGFARLLKEGTWYQDMRFAHAITETAAGHASLYTGAVPHDHGIVSNDIRSGTTKVGILVNTTTQVVSASGVGTDPGTSMAAVHGETVADRLRSLQPRTKIFSFSLKDRGAVVAGGHHPDLTLWYDTKLGQFVTSTAFANAIPDWAMSAVGPRVIEQKLNEPWLPLDVNWLGAHALTKDTQVGESDYEGYGTTFPHVAAHCKHPLIALRIHPATDRVLLDLGLEAVRRAPGDSPVFLALSLSANDYIGHFFGPDSWEAWDELRRLDAALADFFSALDALQGQGNWSVVLAADHGVLPLPEVNRELARVQLAPDPNSLRPRDVGGRILPEELDKIARTAAEQTLGKGDWVAAVIDPYLYYSDTAKQLPLPKFARLRRAVAESLAKVAGVRQLFEVERAARHLPT